MKINKNPLAMRGLLKSCWLFTYRSPIESVQALAPAPLKLVAFGGFAFWNIVVCRVESLRPAPIPAILGLGYWHVAYRLCVRAKLGSGEEIEGLYFVRSECDSPIIARFGNWMTDFAFNPARIAMIESPAMVAASIVSSSGNTCFCIARGEPASLAAGSPFASMEEAAAFLKYRPCALSPAGDGKIQVVKVTREEARWRCRPVCVKTAAWPFLRECNATFELCFEADPIEYQWNSGETLEAAA